MFAQGHTACPKLGAKPRLPRALSLPADLTAEAWPSSLLELVTLSSCLKPLGRSTLALRSLVPLGEGRASEGIGVIYLLFFVFCLSWLLFCFALPRPPGTSGGLCKSHRGKFLSLGVEPSPHWEMGEGKPGGGQDGRGQPCSLSSSSPPPPLPPSLFPICH